MATESVFRRLQKHIDNMPVAYPATEWGVELRRLIEVVLGGMEERW